MNIREGFSGSFSWPMQQQTLHNCTLPSSSGCKSLIVRDSEIMGILLRLPLMLVLTLIGLTWKLLWVDLMSAVYLMLPDCTGYCPYLSLRRKSETPSVILLDCCLVQCPMFRALQEHLKWHKKNWDVSGNIPGTVHYKRLEHWRDPQNCGREGSFNGRR